MATGSSIHARYVNWVNARTDTERTLFFSNAVFAIAMMLLAVQIVVPKVAPGQEVLRQQIPSTSPTRWRLRSQTSTGWIIIGCSVSCSAVTGLFSVSTCFR
jgi:hypothetical protein